MSSPSTRGEAGVSAHGVGNEGVGHTVGVLALQGDVAEHLLALRAVGARPVTVRTAEELHGLDGLVLPGGESTTISKLARIFGLTEPLRVAIAGGLPTFGTCAGMILLADRILDGVEGQETLGGLDVTVRRNAFGRQVDSFEGPVAISIDGVVQPMHGVFIRAPWVEECGAEVEVVASCFVEGDTRIVGVRAGHLLATSFHPEVTTDLRMHQLFLDMVRQAATARHAEQGA